MRRLIEDLAEAPLIPPAFIDRYARSEAYSPARRKDGYKFRRKLLTDTQFNVMLGLSQGKTYGELKFEGVSYDPKQIAQIAKTRLGAVTTAQAVGIAVARGVLPPPDPIFPPGEGFVMAYGEASRKRLTPREKQVLVRLANGMTNQQIADEFGTTLNTVKEQVKTLHKKYSSHTQAQLVALAIRMGHIR